VRPVLAGLVVEEEAKHKLRAKNHKLESDSVSRKKSGGIKCFLTEAERNLVQIKCSGNWGSASK
jgi:hypothetical protein